MLPWILLVISALFALASSAGHYDFEDGKSSLHDIRARRQVPSSTPAATESSSNDINNPENLNQRLLTNMQDETSTSHLYYDGQDSTPQYNSNYYRHPPPPRPWPPPPPRFRDGHYGYYRPPLPPHDGRYPRRPDDFGPPHRRPPPPSPFHGYRSGPPPPGYHRPPPPHRGPPPGVHRPLPPHGPPPAYHRTPHGHPPPPPPYGRGPPDYGYHRPPPFRHSPSHNNYPQPGGHGPPSDRREPPSGSGIQPESRESSSSIQSADNERLIRNLKVIFGQTDQNESSNGNLASVINAEKLNHKGGEALSGFTDANANNFMVTSPSPHGSLFQVVPVTPED